MKNIKKKTSERLNLYLDLKIYNELKQKSEEAFLPLATLTRQLIRKQLQYENNLRSKNNQDSNTKTDWIEF
jgi:hypothetical protein